MAKYTGPVCRLCRREGEKLFLKGTKCFDKCTFDTRAARAAFRAKPASERENIKNAVATENPEAAAPQAPERRPARGGRNFGPRVTPPGQHGAARKKATDYSAQLREKQKCKRYYGLLEKQFHSYYAMAENMRGVTGENMLSLIERRLDNVVFRAHLGVSRAQARQIVNHGLITVNGKVVDIPSYLVKVGDVISVKKEKKDKLVFDGYQIPANCPEWLSITTGDDTCVAQVKVVRVPLRADCEQSIKEHLIVELYSK